MIWVKSIKLRCMPIKQQFMRIKTSSTPITSLHHKFQVTDACHKKLYDCLLRQVGVSV